MIRHYAQTEGRILDNGCGLGAYLNALRHHAPHRFGLEVEFERAEQALPTATGIVQGVGERLPYGDGVFQLILSNEVIEHVQDDRACMAEMARVLAVGGRIVLFCPNRWYPVEQHGIYWRGQYHFGNKPLVNYLPDLWRNQLAPHVRVYTRRGLLRLIEGLPLRVVAHTRIFGGYDNIVRRSPKLGRLLQKTLYALEKTPARLFGLSHLLVLEKTP